MRAVESGRSRPYPAGPLTRARRNLAAGVIVEFNDGGDAVEPTRYVPGQFVRQALRFAEWVEADPDFELAGVHSPGVVCFRAAPPGLDAQALDALNADLLDRVNAGAEVSLSRTRAGGGAALELVVGGASGTADVERAWDVVTDAFRGILVDSTDPRLRWDCERACNPAAA